jgi:hypothetical protein
VTDDDPEERRNRYQRAGAAAGGALVGGLIGGPVGAIAGAALGPLLEPLARQVWTELSARGQQRAADMLASACDAGIHPDELADRISASDRTELLTGYSLAAATRTAWQDKVRTLGRSLASGLLAEDEAQIDTEQMIIAAIADIEAPQLSLLEFLVRWEPGQTIGRPPVDGPLDIPAYSHVLARDGRWHVRNRAWTIRQIASNRPRLAPVAPSLLGTLQRHGLAVQNDNTSEAIERHQKELESAIGRQYRQDSHRGVFSPRGVPRVMSAGNLVPEPTWSPTELGEKVYLRFRDAGTQLPDVWASGPAGHQRPSV